MENRVLWLVFAHIRQTGLAEGLAGVPHGRTNHGGVGDRGAWHDIPERNGSVWLGELKARYDAILAKHPKLDRGNHANHLGTLGTGNHFVEICLDESETVWFMLHSGIARSRQSHGELPSSTSLART
jgi:hypothetical protein